MWSVMPCYPQHLLSTWSYYYFLQWNILSYVSTLPHDLALMGDFNLRIDSSSSDAGQLSGILESFDLHQCVDFHAHSHGHSLHLMICSTGCSVLFLSTSDLILDHFSVVAYLQIPSNHSQTVPQTIKYWKLQLINIEAFKADMTSKNLYWLDIPKAMQLDWLNNITVSSANLINLHAPLVTKEISQKSPSPWLTPDIVASKRHRRYLEHASGVEIPTALNRVKTN